MLSLGGVNKTFFYSEVFGRVFVIFAILTVLFTVFLLLSNKAHAANAGEFVHFRIDSELDVLIADKGTLTIRWTCGSGLGLVEDGTASESTNSPDGIVKVASASKEMTDAGCIFGTSDTITASSSIDGWVAREWSVALPASGSDPFTTRASMDFTIVVNGVDDELGTAIEFDSDPASASYSGTVASQSYSGGKKYIAGSTSGGTVTAEADGYVKATSSALAISSTASQSVDFGTGDDSSLDEDGLDFAHKIRVYESGGSFAGNKITAGTVTAGDSLGTTCTNNSDGNWYCAVPLADTETTAQFSQAGWVTKTATYSDRTTEAAAQTTADITPVTVPPSGGGGSPVVTPTPTPTVSTSPTPTPAVSSTPTPSVGSVKLYRKVSDPKVYVQGSDGTLTWVRTLEEFNAAGYNWADVQVISGEEFGKMRVGGHIKVVMSISFLRIRSGPSTADKIIGQVLPDQELKFTEMKNGWYKIDAGWVSGVYVKEF